MRRLEAWAVRHPLAVGGVSLTRLGIRVVGSFLDVRVMGLSAEMTYYALLSIFPMIGALGASLGFVERWIGTGAAVEAEAAIVRAVEALFSAEATAEVITPLVQGVLREERTGFAVGGFLLSLFFASRVFRSAIDTLDSAYRVEERRGTVALWGLGFLFSLGAVLVGTVMLAMVVVGPLLGGGRVIAEWLGMGRAFELVWALARWPVLFLIATSFLALLYRWGPNVRNTWLQCLPGAAFGMAALVLVSVAFRVYLEATGLDSPAVQNADDAVQIALQVIGAMMAALFWLWLSSMALLTGGVVNAELSALRGERLEAKA